MGLSFESDKNIIVSSLDEMAVTDGLSVYYNFDDLSDSSLIDNSGNNNTASIYNITYNTGVSGNAISLNGTSSYLEAGYANSTAFTLSCWYKGTFTGTTDVSLFSLARTNSTDRFGLFIDSSGYLNSMINSSTRLNSNTAINNNAWHFCLATVDGSNAYIYVDGIQKNTVAVSLTTDYYNLLRVGRNFSSNYCSGLVDGVRLYNRALTAIEVKQLYKLYASNTVLSIKEE